MKLMSTAQTLDAPLHLQAFLSLPLPLHFEDNMGLENALGQGLGHTGWQSPPAPSCTWCSEVYRWVFACRFVSCTQRSTY